jgi:hypothetical protein
VNEEAAMYERAIVSSAGRILASLDGLDDGALNWRPPAEDANSLYALAAHTLANVERNVMHTFAGEPYAWDREAEFAATGPNGEDLVAQWDTLRRRIHAALRAATPGDLERLREHPRLGAIPGRAVLLQAARHAAEHAGQAELTRALLRVVAQPEG